MGLERLRRYSDILVPMRNTEIFPFRFSDDKGIGLYDFSADHIYQLLRMTLLAKKTTPMKMGNLIIEDYRIVHLSHSANTEIETLHGKYLNYSPGFQTYGGEKFHDFWINILSDYEGKKFVGGNWDNFIPTIKRTDLRDYLMKRYFNNNENAIDMKTDLKIQEDKNEVVRFSGQVRNKGIHPDEWHFSHLGFDYFERIIAKIAENERKSIESIKSNIKFIGIGRMGVPYIEKRNGRQVNPNWHVITNDGKFFRGKSFVVDVLWPFNEVNSFEWQEILDWFWPKH